jgi:hypothetical protein
MRMAALTGEIQIVEATALGFSGGADLACGSAT